MNLKLVLCLGVFLSFSMVSAQTKKDGYQSHFPTENVTMGLESNKGKNRPKRKHISYLYTENSKNILYGNPCALEATRKMGFEYVVQPLGIPGSPGEKDFELNNFLVKMKLVFTRSPFWKVILNKRIRECAEKSGDIVG
ncbi:MAG: hypothetical protein RJQ14_05285 [Marinoscillum sp.]